MGLDIDVERLIADHLGAGILSALALFAWLALVARRAEKARSLVDLCREAVRIREGQERLRASGRPAPFLERTRETEAAVRSLLRRYGLEAAPAAPEGRPSTPPAPAPR